MKIEHNPGLCEAHGVCTAIAPDRFELDDDDQLIVHGVDVSEDQVADMRLAVESCPRQALSLKES